MGGAGREPQAADAFGRRRSSLWQRFRGEDSAAPRRVTRLVAFVGGLVVFAVGGHGLGAALGVTLVLWVPGGVVERFYRARRRREREELLPPL